MGRLPLTPLLRSDRVVLLTLITLLILCCIFHVQVAEARPGVGDPSSPYRPGGGSNIN